MPAKPLLVLVLPPRPSLGAVSITAMWGFWGWQTAREGSVDRPSVRLLLLPAEAAHPEVKAEEQQKTRARGG